MSVDKVAASPNVFLLNPINSIGLVHVFLATSLTWIGLYLSLSDSVWSWFSGQLILAVAFLQWFILLHEAGHGTLFRTRALNTIAGHVAGFLAGIPYVSWRLIHYQHHKWTGWQDLDPTTTSLVPRTLATAERIAINLCWRLWIPMFNVIYRINNYWNYPRICRYIRRKRQRRRVAVNIAWLLVMYGILFSTVGVWSVLSLTWLGLVLSLVIQENVLLSQHTHIPSNLTNGRMCSPFTAREQAAYTRSIKVPTWVSRLVLVNFDRHELHHVYVRVPGYHLHRIECTTENDVDWWTWLIAARQMDGETFLFRDRTTTGFAR